MIVITKKQGRFLNMLLAFFFAAIILFFLSLFNTLLFHFDYLDRYVRTGFTIINGVGVIIGAYNLVNAARHADTLKKMNVFYMSIFGSVLCIAVNVYALMT